MNITGSVMAASVEEREMTNKEGQKRMAKIAHVLLTVKTADSVEVVNIRSYDPSWSLPEVGKQWTSPRVRKYENFDGMVGDVTV